MTLTRLGKQHAREMVVQAAAQSALPGQMIDTVVVRSDGVPLFVEELTRAVVEAGAEEAREIPATLHDSLMARLDRLGHPAKEAAQVGAVLGREFPYTLVHAVHPVPELEAALAALVDAELLYVRGLPPEATYHFKHALVQDAAYGSLLKSRRRALHTRVARVLSETAESQPEVLAHHYSEAGDAERAVPAWQRAGERALERGALGEAVGHLRRGFAVLDAARGRGAGRAGVPPPARTRPGAHDGEGLQLVGDGRRLCAGTGAG